MIKLRLTKYVTRFDDCGTNNKERNKIWEDFRVELDLNHRANIISNNIDIYILHIIRRSG